MKIEDYQCLTQETAIYPKSSALEYLALGLASESGEVASIVKKKMRDKTDKLEFYDSLLTLPISKDRGFSGNGW